MIGARTHIPVSHQSPAPDPGWSPQLPLSFDCHQDHVTAPGRERGVQKEMMFDSVKKSLTFYLDAPSIYGKFRVLDYECMCMCGSIKNHDVIPEQPRCPLYNQR